MVHVCSERLTECRAAYLGNSLGKALERKAFLPLFGLLIITQHIVLTVVVRHCR